jgi:hypothetical protein
VGFSLLAVAVMRLSASATNVHELGEDNIVDITTAEAEELTVLSDKTLDPVMLLQLTQEARSLARDNAALRERTWAKVDMEQTVGEDVTEGYGDYGNGSNGTANDTTSASEYTPPTTGGNCDEQIDLMKECRDAIMRTQTLLHRIVEEAPAVLPADKLPGATSMLELGEELGYGDANPEDQLMRPTYCVDNFVMLKQCHTELYKATAFIEHVGAGTDGEPRPGFPGSKVPNGANSNILASGVIVNATNDPAAAGLDKTQQHEIEHQCRFIQAAEVLKDTDAYKLSDVKKANIDTRIQNLNEERVAWFAHEMSIKVATGASTRTYKRDDLPRCQGCWLRRRRASALTFGEINSCQPAPTPRPTPFTPAPTVSAAELAGDQTDLQPIIDAAGNATKAPTAAPISGGMEAGPAVDEGTVSPSEQQAPTSVSDSSGTTSYTLKSGYQDKFFNSVLTYDSAGTWSCNADFGAANCPNNSGTNLMCETRNAGVTATACADRCKACDLCKGFNFVVIPYADSTNSEERGMCTYHQQDPSLDAGAFRDCATMNGTTCDNPGLDPKFFCCSAGSYFEKEVADLPSCPTCCTASGADKCDGPQCDASTCVVDPTANTCQGATVSACCRASPPCDASSCAACPVPTVDGEQTFSGTQASSKMGGSTMPTGSKWNMVQGATAPPADLTVGGYYNPTELQGKFFQTAFLYQGNGAVTCTDQGAGVGEFNACDAKAISGVANCKLYCDADTSCVGFNFIYNDWSMPAANWTAGSSPSPAGGTCVFFKTEPTSSSDALTCADWEGSEPSCLEPKLDAMFFCCRKGYYYKKGQAPTPPPGPACATDTGNTCDFGGSVGFTYNQNYNYCITSGHTTAWCGTSDAAGWGDCGTRWNGNTGCPYTAEEGAAFATAVAAGLNPVCQTTAQTTCNLPFSYSPAYHSCIQLDTGANPYQWCYTDLTTGAFGNCDSNCPTYTGDGGDCKSNTGTGCTDIYTQYTPDGGSPPSPPSAAPTTAAPTCFDDDINGPNGAQSCTEQPSTGWAGYLCAGSQSWCSDATYGAMLRGCCTCECAGITGQ